MPLTPNKVSSLHGITRDKMIVDFLGLQKERYHEAVKRAHEVLENFQSHFVVDSSEVKSEPVRGGNPGIPSQDANRISQFQITKNKPSHTTDVVIGMAQKTDPKNLVVFCASLRKYSFISVFTHFSSSL
jgi:hypothetical protein